MATARWRSRLFPAPADRRLASWLTEPGSLTARCQAASGHFRIRLLSQGSGRPLPDEAAAVGMQRRQRAWVREVLLECDGVPVIYAHTILPRAPRGRLAGWLAGLGSRSLGSLLFAHPGFARGAIEFRRLDRRHPLYGRADRCAGKGDAIQLWARRSAHRLGGQTVLVTEVFLPWIVRLER
ncbi:MAG: chorismate lyase [Rhodocyclaceae bacterium]|nr:chorismate lyase [Rhodocyclaceae bacterium]